MFHGWLHLDALYSDGWWMEKGSLVNKKRRSGSQGFPLPACAGTSFAEMIGRVTSKRGKSSLPATRISWHQAAGIGFCGSLPVCAPALRLVVDRHHGSNFKLPSAIRRMNRDRIPQFSPHQTPANRRSR